MRQGFGIGGKNSFNYILVSIAYSKGNKKTLETLSTRLKFQFEIKSNKRTKCSSLV